MAYWRLDPPDTQTSRRSFNFGARISKRLILVSGLITLICLAAFTKRHELKNVELSSALDYATTLSNSAFGIGEDQASVDADNAGEADEDTIDKRSCLRRRQKYRALVDDRDLQGMLNWDSKDELVSQPFLLAKSQPLFSDVCWTREARYGHYSSGAGSTVNACNEVSTTGNRTVVVLRLEDSNIFTADAIDNLRALIIEVAWYHEMDIVVLQNIESHEGYNADKVPEEFRPYLINFVNDEIFENYPLEIKAKSAVDRINLNYRDKFSRYTTTYMQFLQTWFFTNHPQYKFAYFFESHVRSLGSYQELFAGILKDLKSHQSADLITLDPIVTTRPSVYWGTKEATMPESFFRAKFIVHGLSRRLGLALGDALQSGMNAPHDAFLPAVAIKNGMNIFMYAHPIAKQKNGLLFETYKVPDNRDFTILNLAREDAGTAADETANSTAWQFGGTFAADSVKWVDDLPQTLWIDNIYQSWREKENTCHPGLLIYPVSGR